MNFREIATQKRAVSARICKIVAPHLYRSGYTDPTEADGYLRVVVFRGYTKNWAPRKLKGGHVLTEYAGFTKGGVITEAYGGGLCDARLIDLPLEDLLRLERDLTKRPPRWQAKP